MSEKGFGKKIFGLFVEGEQPGPPGAADDGERLSPARTPAHEEVAADIATLGKVDFDSIFRQVGMDPGELDRVAKAEQLLRELPQDSSQAMKKQIVEAALRAFGIEIQRIVAAAQNQQKALDTYVQVNETAIARELQEAETQIKLLTGKISALRTSSEERGAGLGQLNAAAQARKAQLQRVLDFFQSPNGQGGPPVASDRP